MKKDNVSTDMPKVIEIYLEILKQIRKERKMSYRLINANDLNGVISDADYEKVLNMPCVFADLPNGMDGKHYDLQSNSDEDCISRKDAEMCLTANITDMTIEEYISMVGDRLKALPSVQPIRPLIDNPCIECGGNCCWHEDCEYRKVEDKE